MNLLLPRLLCILRSRRGEGYVDLLITLAIVMSLILCFVAIAPIITTKLQVDQIASQLTRVIELTGEIGNEYDEELSRIKTSTGIDPTISINATTLDGHKIQLRERFTLSVTVIKQIKLTDPTFGDGLTVDVPINKTLTGMSEVYWK